MKIARPSRSSAVAPAAMLALAAFLFTSCKSVEVTHVAPGKSARALLAEREKAKNAPADVAPPLTAATDPSQMPPGQLPPGALPPLPAGDVKLPSGNGEAVAEAYSRGSFAMQAGQNAEAITAFEQTVKLDPDFTDAWTKLAMLYQKTGNNAKATEAFKKAKKLGDMNGSTVQQAPASRVLVP